MTTTAIRERLSGATSGDKAEQRDVDAGPDPDWMQCLLLACSDLARRAAPSSCCARTASPERPV
jgi:hypothetical protein